MKKLLLTLIALALTAFITYIATPRPYMVHWHANFAMYIDGVQRDFSGTGYMEETSRCNITEGVKPEDRIHLHDNHGELVHVHMAASTWGDLFANIGIGVGKNYVIDNTYDERYLTGSGKNLYYFVDGKPVDNPANITVESEDRLLVWYGTGTLEEIQGKSDTLVAKNAHEYNQKSDPASCSTNIYGWASPIVEPIMEWFEHHE